MKKLEFMKSKMRMQQASHSTFIGTVINCVIFVALSSTAQSVPPLINYQGRLADANGAPVADGPKLIAVSLYDKTSNDGTLLWGPKAYPGTPVVKGQFNIILGMDEEGDSITDAVSNATAYLQLSVEGADIEPRQQLLSTPYAVVANYTTNDPPVGSIIPWMPIDATQSPEVSENQIRPTYRICDGPDTEDDPATRFDETKIPDLRDRFVKGVTDEAEAEDFVGRLEGKNASKHSHSGKTSSADRNGPSEGAAQPFNNHHLVTETDHRHAFSTGDNSDAGERYSNAPNFMSVYFIIRVR